MGARKYFKAKVDYIILVFPLIMLVPFCILIYIESNSIGIILMLLLLACIVGFLIFRLLKSSRYYIDEEKGLLIIKILFISKSIPIKNIREIKKSGSLMAGPAPSFDRIKIRFGASRADSVLISPLDKEGFINTLISINDSITIR